MGSRLKRRGFECAIEAGGAKSASVAFAPGDIGWDLAMRFNNHRDRLILLKASGSSGIVFRRWTDDQP
ncbi:MAG: hypothetical protein OXE95_01955 [Chloroflexi bacterium]|nr:hypothetical protein [Chloroflexota bacterium]MCY4246325.1 hypothetical protein [Chloroflexota bacterium]